MDKRESPQQTRSRELFNSKIDSIMKEMFGSILDFVEVAIGSKEKFMPLRSKILRVSNDAVRNLKKELERHYIMDYVSDTREVLIFKQPRNHIPGQQLNGAGNISKPGNKN